MKNLSFILAICVLFSCEDTREFELDSFQREVVLNAIISTDSIWDVGLSYTKSIFDESDFELIKDAEVRVLNLTNGQSFFLDRKRKGHYSRELNPVEGHEYDIRVTIPGKEEVRARTYVPSVLEVDVFSNLIEDNNGDNDIEINIAITDNPNEENFYVWELLPVGNMEQYIDRNAASIATSTSPYINGEGTEGQGSSGGDNQSGNGGNTGGPPGYEDLQEYQADVYSFDLSDDTNAEGVKKKELSDLSFLSENDVKSGIIANKLILDSSVISEIDSDYQIVSENEIVDKAPLFELKVMAVSSELFKYLKSYEDYKNSDIKNTSISDPLLIYSNIENGLGIFGGYNLKTFYIY